MKKLPLIAAIALACTVGTSWVLAQSAMFTYTGVPASPVVAGSSFTIGINLVVTSGGTVNNIQGLSYWLYQASPVGPYPFAIISRDITGSLFTQVLPLFFPQPLDPINRIPGPLTSTDLGQGLPPGQPGLPSGTYFLANLTFSVASGSVPGSYTLVNANNSLPGVGGRISIWNDNKGDTAPIAASSFNVTVVPEPSSIALLCVGLLSAGALACRRRVLKPAESNL